MRLSNTFAETLNRLLEEHGLSQADFSRDMKIHSSSVNKYCRGARKPSFKVVARIAEFFNVSIDTLIDANYQELQKVRHFIPILGEVRAGMPELIFEENIIDYVKVDEKTYNSGELFGLKIKGDSMLPRFHEGDVVIIRKQNNANSGDIVVVLVNGEEATIKKLRKTKEGIDLIPLNSRYDIISYSNNAIIKKPVKILGKVIELRAKI